MILGRSSRALNGLTARSIGWWALACSLRQQVITCHLQVTTAAK
jgi:hypothetical protein